MNIDKYNWNTGFPPHVGWWLCGSSIWRWYDGIAWSMPVVPYSVDYENLNFFASWHEESPYKDKIVWSDFYPKDVIVQRINPETGEVTGRLWYNGIV